MTHAHTHTHPHAHTHAHTRTATAVSSIRTLTHLNRYTTIKSGYVVRDIDYESLRWLLAFSRIFGLPHGTVYKPGMDVELKRLGLVSTEVNIFNKNPH